MLNISEANKNLYRNGSHVQMVINVPNKNITLTNSDLVADSAELTESIESGNSLSFMGCIATKFKFSCADVIEDIRGEYIEVSITPDSGDALPLFKGYIDSQDNQTHEDLLTTFTAYDVMTKVNSANVSSWYNSLSFPMTIKNFRDSFWNYFNIIDDVPFQFTNFFRHTSKQNSYPVQLWRNYENP